MTTETASRPWLRRALIGAAGLVALTAVAARMLFAVPDDLDLSTTKPTEAGRYVVSLSPEDDAALVGAFQRWIVGIASPAGEAVTDARVALDGDMPQHGHGLPTSPEVTGELGEGRYLVEGMRFSMGGWWTITVVVDGAAGTDTVTFNLVL